MDKEIVEAPHGEPEKFYKDMRDPASIERSQFQADSGAPDKKPSSHVGTSHEKQKATTKRKLQLKNKDSMRWGAVTFICAPSNKKGDFKWEVTCPRTSHITRTKTGRVTKCRKVIGFTKAEDKEQALHVLKAWVIAGGAVTCRSRKSHAQLFKEVIRSKLPSLHSLETQCLELFPDGRTGSDCEADPKKRCVAKKVIEKPDVVPSSSSSDGSSYSSSPSSDSD